MKDKQQYTYDIIDAENDNQKILDLLEQYANERVIDELDKLKIEDLGMYNGVEDVNIYKRIKELKQ